MDKRVIRKLSMLGFVLMATSAVVAAVISKKNVKGSNDNGTLRTGNFGWPTSELGNKTCITNTANTPASCTKTEWSSLVTTDWVTGDNESTFQGRQTLWNTSDTKASPGDQTSQVW